MDGEYGPMVVKYNGGGQSTTDTCVSHYDYDTQDL